MGERGAGGERGSDSLKLHFFSFFFFFFLEERKKKKKKKTKKNRKKKRLWILFATFTPFFSRVLWFV